ncbi:F-box/FBD/LRR-repeat protein At2g26030-like [Papaver somniferum]|uniref:F-box/FBD/LRR-repeat protein At2g26030-like n=1 Tax=Papaver somniferum TaxID=3469 RepID=UPI000E6F6B27|nr:F-box/FBD/LRR-repeat protein At2g26030-like [Papaver somniferum]
MILRAFYYERIFIEEPFFHDLRRLEVSTNLSRTMSIGFIRLLLVSPNLESVVINQGFSEFQNYLTSDRQIVPECLLGQLKVVEVQEFSGDQEILDFIRYFLKNSLVLQTMKVAFASSTSQHLQDSLMKEILTFTKDSTYSVIDFLS